VKRCKVDLEVKLSGLEVSALDRNYLPPSLGVSYQRRNASTVMHHESQHYSAHQALVEACLRPSLGVLSKPRCFKAHSAIHYWLGELRASFSNHARKSVGCTKGELSSAHSLDLERMR